MVRDDLKKQGYDREEEYFYRLNKETLEKKRQARDAQRSAQETREKQSLHWMKCPKCGNEMEEIELAGIKVDRCKSCQGIYFDHGELETLLESREPQGFLESLKRWLR